MKPVPEIRRFVYQTQGVCPPEIHFQLNRDILENIRFVGGGCPGNAQLVARLIKGRPVEDILPQLEGIECRNETSCPDQLARAIHKAVSGRLKPADSFRLQRNTIPTLKIGLIGDLDGSSTDFEAIHRAMGNCDVETVYCVGNLTGRTPHNRTLIKALRQKENVTVIQGKRDWQYASDGEPKLPPMDARERDWLVRLPQVLAFRLGNRNGVAFFGEYLQHLPGFSDFEPFALEMNMVCGLTRLMRDETVFPALEAMIPQFTADIVVFGQGRHWGHWRMGGKDIISVGPAHSGSTCSWGILEIQGEEIAYQIKEV